MNSQPRCVHPFPRVAAAQHGPDHTDADRIHESTREGSREVSRGQEGTLVLNGNGDGLRTHSRLLHLGEFVRRSVLNHKARARCKDAGVVNWRYFRIQENEQARVRRKKQQRTLRLRCETKNLLALGRLDLARPPPWSGDTTFFPCFR
jgi:hypothetical protein